MGNGYKHYAGLTGSKIRTVGADADIFQYTNLETAIAAAQPKDIIEIEDGTYSLTATNTINKDMTLVGKGSVTINGGTAGLADRMFLVNHPAAGSAGTTIKFFDIDFVNAHSSGDIFEIDNDAGGTGTLRVEYDGCSFNAGASAVCLDVDQNTATETVQVVLKGKPGRLLENCNFALEEAGSYVAIEDYDLSAGATFALGTTDVASVYQFTNCIFGSAAITSGGAASVIVNAVHCSNETSDSVRPLVASDFDHTGVSNVSGGTSGPVELVVASSGVSSRYATLELAYAAAVAGDAIYLEPGSHTVAATVTLNKNISLFGRGRCTVTGAVADRLFMINKPATGTAATYVEMHNIHFVNSTASADVFELDNDGTGTGDLHVTAIGCSFSSNSGLSWDIDQTTNTIDVYVTLQSPMSQAYPIDGLNIALTKAGSEVTINGFRMGASVIALGTTDVAWVLNTVNMMYESEEFTTGGAASAIHNVWNCVRLASDVIEIPAAGDFDATTASNAIIPAS